MLRELGHESLFAPDGAMGLELLKDERVDGILVDLMMPVLDGFGFLEAMRDRVEALPVALITADVQSSVLQRCAELGGVPLLPKPIELDALDEMLRRLLRAAKTA